MKPRPKILFLGFCAGERDLIARWAADGTMPTFRRLFENGLVGRTQGPAGLYVHCTWPSFYTGTGPARMGVHSWEQLRHGTYEFYRASTPDCVRTTPFWDHLSAAGRRVAILDVPHSGPSPRINGVQLVEWGAHDANCGFVTSPPALAAEVVARFGEHPQRGSCNADRSPEQMVQFRDDLLRGIATKTAITKHFLAQEDWDFFAQVFTESHCAGHQCWHLHDPLHPRHDPAAVAVAGDPVKDVYVAIDRAMGEIIDSVDRDTTIVAMAGHGMNAKYVSQFMLGDILVRLGVAEPKAKGMAAPGSTVASAKRALDPVLTWGWQHTPAAAKRWLDPLRHRARDWVHVPSTDIPLELDPAASRCFIIENNHSHGGIRVNLIGREPAGMVASGAACEAFLDALSRDLLDIVDVDTGKRIVTRVMRTKDIYSGPAAEHFPDLLVEWSCAHLAHAVSSPKIGRLDKNYVFCRTGEHNPGGMFIAMGPVIAPGRLAGVRSLTDMAPTFCEALG
ncbi:MAG TPA: alkaline phosphatase family protein, partial [Alphaproteobacteria bacterium]